MRCRKSEQAIVSAGRASAGSHATLVRVSTTDGAKSERVGAAVTAPEAARAPDRPTALELGGPIFRALFGRNTMLFAVAVLAASFVWPAGESRIVLCWFRAATGMPCPGCGLTRSICALSHLRLAEAVRFHPFGPLVYLLLVTLVVALVAGEERRRWIAARFNAHRTLAHRVYWTLVGGFIAFGVVRLGLALLVPGSFSYL